MVSTASLRSGGPLVGLGILGALVVVGTVLLAGGEGPDPTEQDVTDGTVALPDDGDALDEGQAADEGLGWSLGCGGDDCQLVTYPQPLEVLGRTTVAARDEVLITLLPSTSQVTAHGPDGAVRWQRDLGDGTPSGRLRVLDDLVAIPTDRRTVVLSVADGGPAWDGPPAESVTRIDDTVLLVSLLAGEDAEDTPFTLTAHDATDGSLRWEAGPLRSVGPIDGGVLVLDGDVLSKRDADGDVVWERDLDGADDVVTVQDGFPLLVRDGRPLPLDPDDGREVELPEDTGMVVAVDGGDVLTGGRPLQLIRDGEVAWELDVARPCHVAWDDQRVQLDGCDGTDVEVDRTTGTERARSEVDAAARIAAVAGGLRDGELDVIGRLGPLAYATTDDGLVVVDVRSDAPRFALQADGDSRVIGTGAFDDVVVDPERPLVAVPGAIERFVVPVPRFLTDDPDA